MNTDLLVAFVGLADFGTYHAAAQQLNMTQSTLTKKIQRLEALFGSPLFDRGRRGTRLTPTGKILLPGARQLMIDCEQFEQFAKATARGVTGHLSIGFGLSSIKVAPELAARFIQQYPDIQVTLNDMPSQRQLDGLISGKLQVGFSRLPISAPLKGYALFSDRLVLGVCRTEAFEHEIQ